MSAHRDEAQRPVHGNKLFLAGVACVSALVTGCGGSSTGGSVLSGSSDLSDWRSSVCEPGKGGPIPPDLNSQSSEICTSSQSDGVFVFFGQYPSRSAAEQDLVAFQVNPAAYTIASASGGTWLIAASAPGRGGDPSAALAPLERFDLGVARVPGSPSPTSGPTATQRRPTQSAPPPRSGTQLSPNSFGYVSIQTKSGRVRCMIETDYVGCETSETNWPANGVSIKSDGSLEWVDGNLGDIRPVTLNYATYRAMGWTIVASSTGTRFTNDRTGHGALVSVERVSAI